MDDASCSAAYTQLGLNELFTLYAGAVEDEESGLLALAKLRGVATTPELLNVCGIAPAFSTSSIKHTCWTRKS